MFIHHLYTKFVRRRHSFNVQMPKRISRGQQFFRSTWNASVKEVPKEVFTPFALAILALSIKVTVHIINAKGFFDVLCLATAIIGEQVQILLTIARL